MSQSNIRVAVSGATGRMGRQLIKNLLSFDINDQSAVLTGAITKFNSEFIGRDVGSVVGDKFVGITINDSISAIHDDFDVLIDFSCPQSSLKYLDFCKMYKKNIVIGTTGFTQKELLIIKSASSDIGIVLSPNFSVMINLMLILLKRSVSILDRGVDIEIVEMHHRDKSDSPSGTALRMREAILLDLCKEDNNDDEKVSRYCLRNSERQRNNIKISSIRAGGVVGEHKVYFVGSNERLELTHQAFDRTIFANGAIRSAVWLGKMKIGLFDVIDVLDIHGF